jgi:hypothetical protein
MATPSIQLRTHFAVPFAEVRVPDSERLCRELTELFLAKEREGDKWRDRYQRDTQKDIFESGFDLFNWPEPPVQELAKKTHTALVTLVRQLNNYTDEHHEIFPYVGERPRIVVAFNSWVEQDREDRVKSRMKGTG